MASLLAGHEVDEHTSDLGRPRHQNGTGDGEHYHGLRVGGNDCLDQSILGLDGLDGSIVQGERLAIATLRGESADEYNSDIRSLKRHKQSVRDQSCSVITSNLLF